MALLAEVDAIKCCCDIPGRDNAVTSFEVRYTKPSTDGTVAVFESVNDDLVVVVVEIRGGKISPTSPVHC